MSLINDALKKAQRQSADTSYVPVPGSGGRVAKRGAPMAAQTIVLIGAGCVVLVVLSVIGTVFLINGEKPAPKPAVVATPAIAPSPSTASTSPAPAAPAVQKIELVVPKIEVPIAAAPAITPPVTTAPEKPAITSAASSTKIAASEPKPEAKPATTPPVAKPLAQTEEPPAAKPASVTAPATPAARAPVSEERVHNFLDAIRLTGVRSSGEGSRVLMNDHVYRVNDIVDRSLGLKLTKVESDRLIFTDANGTEYVKNF
jgi:hypothetical protein